MSASASSNIHLVVTDIDDDDIPSFSSERALSHSQELTNLDGVRVQVKQGHGPPASSPSSAPAPTPASPSNSSDGFPDSSSYLKTNDSHLNQGICGWIRASVGPLQPHLTHRQLVYLFIQAFGSMLICGGINFAIAYGMYAHSSAQIELWAFPNTIAGDLAVTIFLQGVLIMIIETLLVINDINQRFVRPVAYKAISYSSVSQYFIGSRLQPYIYKTGNFGFLLFLIIRGLVLDVCTFFIWWPIGVIILIGVKKDAQPVFDHYYTPQICKCVYAGIHGLIITPLIAYWCMCRRSYQFEFETGLRLPPSQERASK